MNGLEECYNLLWYGHDGPGFFGFLVSMKVEVPWWKVFGAWQSMPATARHCSSCDGWCSVDEFYGGLGSWGILIKNTPRAGCSYNCPVSCGQLVATRIFHAHPPRVSPKVPRSNSHMPKFCGRTAFLGCRGWLYKPRLCSLYGIVLFQVSRIESHKCSAKCVIPRETAVQQCSPVISNVGLSQADG